MCNWSALELLYIENNEIFERSALKRKKLRLIVDQMFISVFHGVIQFKKVLQECSHNQMNQKNTLSDHKNAIKIVILFDIFLSCHFNAMLIMEYCVK